MADVEEDAAAHLAFLDKHVFDCREFNEYLELCGGTARLEELRRQELFPS